MRREFDLGPDDIRTLEALGYRWETIKQGPSLWLILHDFPIPAGYNISVARVAIRLDTYPSGMIDMAYFFPPLSRLDGRQINNLTPFPLDGATYQQWSRHYAWTAGKDSLATHIRKVRGWLKHEFRKR
ncbi:E2/UBC family protein [Sphingomonas abietis]|uniref:UBC core domain-containing protein n=1 Tax=Sphingomonas abietis TaxID=3012344 RepID=A0ABY7NMI4_9SPHN|nr:E2/UBC family protein [Sphingomonas abietis]WBO22718.1 hypothetical protein PBT88_00750 [Sphingomonas abietis]